MAISKENSETKNFLKSAIWNDLKIPVLWIPLLSFIANFTMNKLLFKYDFYGTSKISNTELLLFALFSALIINAAYLILPLIIRFLILKHPMRHWGWKTIASSIIIVIVARAFLRGAGFITGSSGTVPILQEIGIYLVLVAGRPRQSLYFTEKENSTKKINPT